MLRGRSAVFWGVAVNIKSLQSCVIVCKFSGVVFGLKVLKLMKDKLAGGLISIGGHQVPALWQRILPEDFFHLKFPTEHFSSCQSCPQIEARGFGASHKCCTYLPLIPNFMMGYALEDNRSASAIRRLIETRYMTLEGSHISPIAYRDSLLENARGLFGKSEKIRCPLIDETNGSCGAYAYRNSVCSTFFCDNLHGAQGSHFWEKVQSLVGQVETAVAQWCMTRLGFDLDRYFMVFENWSQRIDDTYDAKTGGWSECFLRELHQDFYGKEAEFYRACAKELSDFSGDVFEEISCFKIRDNWNYQSSFHSWLCEESRAEFGADMQGAGVPVSPRDLWYELQLNHRELWSIPFNEAEYRLAPGITIQKNMRDSALGEHFSDNAYQVVSSDSALIDQASAFITRQEAASLKLFEAPRQITGELLSAYPFADCQDPRALVSFWLRKSWITPVNSGKSH